MNEPISLRHTIIPKSDQLNADELLAGPMTIRVTHVTVSNSPDQPVSVHYEGDNGKPYKPCKSMRKVMIFAWGDDGRDWVGRYATLYNDPEIKFGGVKVGGIRISHMSDIQSDIAISITETKGKKKPVTIRKMVPQKQNGDDRVNSYAVCLSDAAAQGMQSLREAWMQIPKEFHAALKQHLDALKPTAEAADAKKSEGDQLRGFTAAQPLPDEPLPAQQPEEQPQEQPPAPQEQF